MGFSSTYHTIKQLTLLICFVILAHNTQAQFYDGTKTEFGQNRVQFDEFEWKYYRFEKLETYFYTGGKELAVFTAKTAQKHIDEQEKLFDYYLKDRIQFIIYNKQSHFKQSNVGIATEEEDLAGTTNIIGSKVFIYFNGDHYDFEQQIKKGIAEILVYQQIYGANWRQVLKNSALMQLPDWYIKGLTSYASDNWNPEIENKVRDGILTGKYKKFNHLTGKEAIIAGHSLWNYIANTYGKSVIPNIIYMTRVSQSIEKGFLFVLGVSMKSLTKEWLAYYENKYKNLINTKSSNYEIEDAIKIRKNRTYQHFTLSPNGDYYSYVTNQYGQYKVYIYNIAQEKNKKIYKRDFKLNRLNDYTFPITAWHPSGELFVFVTEEKGKLKLNFYDLENKQRYSKNIFNLEKILSMSYAPNGKELLFSAVYKGQSDIYLYNIGANSQKKLTDDVFDDLDPKFISNTNKIIFTSNRISDSLGYSPTKEELYLNYKDVWILDKDNEKKPLTRVTTTPNISEIQPFGVDSMLSFLRPTKSGLINRFTAKKDSFITHIDTSIHYYTFYKPQQVSNYDRNILEHQLNTTINKYTEQVVKNYKYKLMVKNLNDLNSVIDDKEIRELDNSSTKDTSSTTNNTNSTVKTNTLKKSIPFKPINVVTDTTIENPININYYIFNSDKVEKKNLVIVNNGDTINKDTIIKEFVLPNQRNYNLSFFDDNSTVQLNNSFINGQYQVFTGGPYTGPGLGGAIKFGIADLFEDYKVYGGLRIAGSVNEYFMSFQNLVNRLDKEYTFTRAETEATDGFFIYDIKTNSLHQSFSWPFSEVTSLRFTLTERNDKIITKATDLFSLQADNINEYRVAAKLAYVFDNTRRVMLNIKYGTRFKVFAEYYQQVLDVAGNNGDLQVVGLDFRHYQKISREFIWVSRLAASSSFGNNRLIYYLGSVDDWVVFGGQQRFNQNTEIDPTIPFRYQALAANLRGFSQNIRNGTNFALVNSELRLPVFKYFIRRPIRSNFIKNFQLMTFYDIGTAWNGLNPYDEDNAINKQTITDGPVSVTVFTNTEPLVAGYGFGARTNFLGYYVRADWAWGIENWVAKTKPIFYLSLSLDI